MNDKKLEVFTIKYFSDEVVKDNKILLVFLLPCACLIIVIILYLVLDRLKTTGKYASIVSNIGKNIIAFVLLFSVVFVMVFSTDFQITNIKNKATVSSGYVTAKTTVYKPATIFRMGLTEYILYVDGEYVDALGEATVCTKKYFVDEKTYNEYDVGDYFDSKDIK